MIYSNVKLFNAFEEYLKKQTVITAREAYMRRFQRLYCVMMGGVDALYDHVEGATWFRNVDYAELSLADIKWISDELNGVPNAEDGESSIEEAYPEAVWRNAMLKRSNFVVTLQMVQRLPAVRPVEEYF